MKTSWLAVNDADAVRREFAKRFDANGTCRGCGGKPDPDAPVLERAVWYAKHSSAPAQSTGTETCPELFLGLVEHEILAPAVEIETDRDRQIWHQGHEQGWNDCLHEWQQQTKLRSNAFTVDGSAWFFTAPRQEVVGPFDSLEEARIESCYPLEGEGDELPPGVCPACMGLSPGIVTDGETIMHCAVCNDTGKVTPEQANQWEEEMRARGGGRKVFSA